MLTEREVFELAKTGAKKLALGKKDINATLLKICTEHDPPKVASSRIGWNGDELEKIKKVVTFHAEMEVRSEEFLAYALEHHMAPKDLPVYYSIIASSWRSQARIEGSDVKGTIEKVKQNGFCHRKIPKE